MIANSIPNCGMIMILPKTNSAPMSLSIQAQYGSFLKSLNFNCIRIECSFMITVNNSTRHPTKKKIAAATNDEEKNF